MTEINAKILSMIKDNKSIEEISNEVNLSYKQLYDRFNKLQGYGYNIDRTYHTNGMVKYNIDGKTSYKENRFELKNDLNKFNIMLISDLHMGNNKCDEESLYTIYEYCIKNNIHVIIICGDIIDGNNKNPDSFLAVDEQVDYFIKNYPFDKSIINLYICGNHEKMAYDSFNVSLNTALSVRRHDICPMKNYKHITDSCINNQILKINNNKILLSHISSKPTNDENIKLNIMGHRHASVSVFNTHNSIPSIYVPSIIRNNGFEQIELPRALELEIYLDSNKDFEIINKRDLIILNNKTLLTSETIINYCKEPIKTFKYIDSDAKKNIKSSENKNDLITEVKELGELSDSALEKLKNFYGDDTQNLNSMIKKARPPKRHSYK